jgi:hypothetical protein
MKGEIISLQSCKNRTFAKNIIDGIIEKRTGIILNTGPNFMNFSLGKYFMEQSFHAVCFRVLSFIHFGSKELKRWAPLNNKIEGLRFQWKYFRLFNTLYQLQWF